MGHDKQGQNELLWEYRIQGLFAFDITLPWCGSLTEKSWLNLF